MAGHVHVHGNNFLIILIFFYHFKFPFQFCFVSDVADLPDFELITGHVCALGEQQKCRQVIRILQTAPILSPTFPNIGLNKIQNTSNTITKTNTSNGVLHLFHRD